MFLTQKRPQLSDGSTRETGWIPSTPDFRDYTAESEEVARAIRAVDRLFSAKRISRAEAPEAVDLRAWCSPIEDQGTLGSCTAHAGVGAVEYLERRAFGTHLDGSRLFVYKTTRNLLGVTGDTGAYLRTTMGALALLGVPPERYWPYTTNTRVGAGRGFDEEPSAFVYSLADNFESMSYFRHDPPGADITTREVLASVRYHLARGLPSMFGFFGFPSYGDADVPGALPYPGPREQAIWGHAVVAVGYDDNLTIRNTQTGHSTTGALLIRNSWGTGWGQSGYGWLPYRYVVDRLAWDFWSVFGMRWADTGRFGLA